MFVIVALSISAPACPQCCRWDPYTLPRECCLFLANPSLCCPLSETSPSLSSCSTARASAGPIFKGVCKQFSRSQGHGFITPENGTEDIFVHVSE